MSKFNLEAIESNLISRILYSGYDIKRKSKSPLMKALSKILFFNKGFMTDFVTTTGNTIYVPRDWDDWTQEERINVYSHEYQHIIDRKDFGGTLFDLIYLCPQIFALLAVFAVFNLWFLLFLLFLLPLPSPRALLEYRAYQMSVLAYKHLKGSYDFSPSIEVDVEVISYYADYFCNGTYYWMFPFRSFLRKKFARILIDGQPKTHTQTTVLGIIKSNQTSI